MRLDFNARRNRPGAAGMVILALGVVSVAATLVSYQQSRAEADGLRLRFEALSRAATAPGDLGDSAPRVLADTDAVIAELATPWGRLLEDLEAANADSKRSVAVLSIEPDREHQKVRIFAESRTLPAALAYAERLQQSTALLYPLLDSHEIQTKDQYQPVRFQITAAWRVAP
jgi:hypothetical protein